MWVISIHIYLICIFVVKGSHLPKIQRSLESGTNGISHFTWNGATFQPEAKMTKWILNADQRRKQQSSASLAFVRGIHRRPVNSPHKWPVTRKMFHLMTSSCNTNCIWAISTVNIGNVFNATVSY